MGLKGQDCVLCPTGKSGDKGEHVLPLWFIDRHIRKNPNPEDRYWIEKNGLPLTWPSNKQIELKKFYETLLPCCASCNDILNTRFEHKMEGIGYKAATELRAFTSEEALVLGEWWLKTLLLLVHPDATELQNVGQSTGAGVISWSPPQPELYSWMTDAKGAPPGLSVYVYKVDPSADGADTVLFPLPNVNADNGKFRSFVATMGFEGMGLIVSYHPGWEFEMPIIKTDKLEQLWPHRGAVDLSSLAPVPHSPVQFYGVTVDMTADFGLSDAVVLAGENDFRDLDKLPHVTVVALEKATLANVIQDDTSGSDLALPHGG